MDERQQVVDALTVKYPLYPRTTIERLVTGEMERYASAKVHSFVPVLVQRAVGQRLRDADLLASHDEVVNLRITSQALPARRAG